MTDNGGPVAKKCRIWNPAISDQLEDEEKNNEKPLDFSATKTSQMFQNYLQLAAPLMMRFHHQQQQQQQELARRQILLNNLITSLPPTPNPTQPPPPVQNPIVANALGTPLVNENCCAVCGAAFRLTGDLVQHMRNNHRKSKFKRKSDK